jgi:AcrR family transcriptional regulator
MLATTNSRRLHFGTVTAAKPAAPRRAEILSTAARLFAQHGYRSTTIDDLGGALGLTGPAIYRHFQSKESVLAEMLVDISERLLAEGRKRAAAADSPREALAALLDWHIGFALEEPALITVHERELGHVPAPQRREIRRLQRAYAEEWTQVLRRMYPGTPQARARAAVHAVFGLLNSTPRSGTELGRSALAELLRDMAARALGGSRGPGEPAADRPPRPAPVAPPG